jgi:poly(ADP-ribose) glycohydrolase
MQLDFANRFVGGGVLRGGCIQEEIRFMINPECLASLLFVEVMGDGEAVSITGTERFSKYSGYSYDFSYDGPLTDPTPLDAETQRLQTVIIAIDATHYKRREVQYHPGALGRELLKAYTYITPPSDIHTSIRCMPPAPL